LLCQQITGIITDEHFAQIKLEKNLIEKTNTMNSEKSIYDSDRIIRSLEDGFLRADKTGHIIMANNAIAALCGYASPEEMIGLHMQELYANSQDRDHMISEIKAKGKLINYEIELKRKDGATFWSLNNIKTFCDEKVKIEGTEGVIRDITKIRETEEKLEHTNKVLTAIRNVNQLMVAEKNTAKLLQGICDNLTENRGYHNAWIMLLDEKGKFESLFQSGLGNTFKKIESELKRNRFTNCAKQAFKQKEVIVITNPDKECIDCPLADFYENRGAMTTPIMYEDTLLGLITASIPKKFLIQYDFTLFKEVADDIGLALHNNRVDKARIIAERDRKAANQQLRAANQQLSASEEELKALNQQLAASEQQLMAANQQLRSSEEELRASNQQLAANEQQLRAANQQLIVSEQELRTAKEQAESNEQYYHSILNNIGDPVFVKDDQSRLLFVNDAFCKLFDLERSKIKGKTLAEDVSPEERESFFRIDKEVIRTGKENINEESLTIRGGETLTISTRKSRFIINGKKLLIGIIRDITERKNAEKEIKATNEQLKANEKQLQAANQQLAASEQQLMAANQQLIASEQQLKASEAELKRNLESLHLGEQIASLGYFERNWQTGEGFWSKGFYALLGVNPDEVDCTHEDFMKYIHPDDLQRVADHIQTTLKKQTNMDIGFRLIQSNGKVLHIHGIGKNFFDDDGKALNTIGTFQDITKRKKAEEELLEMSNRLILAMDAGDHGFWDWNLDTNDAFFSPRYFTMLGYEQDELPMKLETWENLLHPDDKKTIIPKVQNYVKNAQPYEVEFRLKTKEGDWKWISGRGKSYEKDPDNTPHRAVGVHVDITERKIVEEELENHRKNLEDIVKKRTSELEQKNMELERYNKIFEGREFRIKELKDKIKMLEEQLRKNY
jgi:PAS domain S-box-containing protein